MNFQIIISGIGGQGVLFATKVISETALIKGYKVIGSETHGMAQRGGSVVSHLKVGNFRSPLVRQGTADIIYAFDKTEFIRTLPFIKKNGICFVNTSQSDFLPARTTVRSGGDRAIEKYLTKNNILIFSVNADKIALDLGSPLSANLIMLGFSIASKHLPFTQSGMEHTIKEITSNKFLDINLKAFRAGCDNWS